MGSASFSVDGFCKQASADDLGATTVSRQFRDWRDGYVVAVDDLDGDSCQARKFAVRYFRALSLCTAKQRYRWRNLAVRKNDRGPIRQRDHAFCMPVRSVCDETIDCSLSSLPNAPLKLVDPERPPRGVFTM
jgi:hypothetical protein